MIELSLYGEATLKQEFSIIPPTNNWIPEYVIDYKKKCCNTCNYFEDDQTQRNIGWCLENITNDLYGEYIKDSDTFYCSYHKLRLNNE